MRLGAVGWRLALPLLHSQTCNLACQHPSLSRSTCPCRQPQAPDKEHWDFGDGSLAAPDAGPAPTHIYGTAALYTVTLIVTDDGGLTDMPPTTSQLPWDREASTPWRPPSKVWVSNQPGSRTVSSKKIQNAQKSFDTPDEEACEKFASFIAAINAQDGKKLTPNKLTCCEVRPKRYPTPTVVTPDHCE